MLQHLTGAAVCTLAHLFSGIGQRLAILHECHGRQLGADHGRHTGLSYMRAEHVKYEKVVK